MADSIESWAECNGVSLHYALSGAGPRSVVLLHALGSTLEAWEPVADRLGPEFRVLRYDQRGTGLSEKVRSPFTLADHVTDLEALLEATQLPPPWYLASLAAGATIALAFAERHAGEVRALGLCAPSTGSTPERAKLLIERSELAVREGMRAIVDESLERSYPRAMITDQRRYDAYRARLLAADPVAYSYANRVLAGADLDHTLATLDVPALLIAGRHDVMRPPAMIEALAGRMRRAQLVVIDAPHIMIVHSPDAVAAQLGQFFRG